MELKHAAAQNATLTTQQARRAEHTQTLEATVAAQSTELPRYRQANAHRVALALLGQDRQSLAKDHAVLTQTHERLLQHSAEQGHVIERLSRGFELDREQDGSVAGTD